MKPLILFSTNTANNKLDFTQSLLSMGFCLSMIFQPLLLGFYLLVLYSARNPVITIQFTPVYFHYFCPVAVFPHCNTLQASFT